MLKKPQCLYIFASSANQTVPSKIIISIQLSFKIFRAILTYLQFFTTKLLRPMMLTIYKIITHNKPSWNYTAYTLPPTLCTPTITHGKCWSPRPGLFKLRGELYNRNNKAKKSALLRVGRRKHKPKSAKFQRKQAFMLIK